MHSSAESCTLRPMPRGDLQFLFGQFVPQCRHEIDKHFDDYCTIQFMAAGAVALRIDDTPYALQGRWFWSAYPGPRVSFHAAGRRAWVHRYLAFRGKLVERWRRDGLFPISPQEAPSAVDYAERFDTMLDVSRRSDRLAIRRATLLLETMLVDGESAASALRRERGPRSSRSGSRRRVPNSNSPAASR